MAFRSDEDALRKRVDALEDELARTKDEAEQLRIERDRALEGAPAPEPIVERPPTRADVIDGARRPMPRIHRGLIAIGLVLVGLTYVLLRPASPPAGTHGIWSTSRLHTGEGVYAEWSGTWYPAHVLAIHGAYVRVHYDGLPATDDESVGFWRLRVRSR